MNEPMLIDNTFLFASRAAGLCKQSCSHPRISTLVSYFMSSSVLLSDVDLQRPGEDRPTCVSAAVSDESVAGDSGVYEASNVKRWVTLTSRSFHYFDRSVAHTLSLFSTLHPSLAPCLSFSTSAPFVLNLFPSLHPSLIYLAVLLFPIVLVHSKGHDGSFNLLFLSPSSI